MPLAAPAQVGSYPTGASPYGVMDMSGNVFEWTSTGFGEPPTLWVVVKSGSSAQRWDTVRIAYRTGAPWDWERDVLGIRCAVSP